MVSQVETPPAMIRVQIVGDHGHGHELGERLYIPGDSRIHDLPAHLKILVAVLTIFAIVLTPAQAVWAFVAYFLIIRTVIGMANLDFRTLLPRLVVEIPFVVFALMMPIIGTAPKIAVGPLLLSEPGLWAAWALIAKATLGVLISVTLAATTQMTEAIAGLRRLRVPDLFVSILTAMIRYLNVVSEESKRMSRARAARGFTGRGPRSWPTLAQSLGTLFIRSYERGERVHLAMMSRGYQGHMPELVAPQRAEMAQWIRSLMLPLLVAGIGVGAVISQWS
jgi:cobalt/nickel transport system permease protein